MLVCRDESIEFSLQDRGTIGSRVQAWVAEMEQRDVRLLGDVLVPVDATITVSMRDGKVDVDHDPRGPMSVPASGFNLLECADIDEAIEVSAKHPIAEFGLIELRPIVET
jgi:hypothetical protein